MTLELTHLWILVRKLEAFEREHPDYRPSGRIPRLCVFCEEVGVGTETEKWQCNCRRDD